MTVSTSIKFAQICPRFSLNQSSLYSDSGIMVFAKTMLKCALYFALLKSVARLTISFHFLALGSKSLLIPDLCSQKNNINAN